MVCGSPIYFVLYGSNVNTELILSLAPYTAETRRVKATFIIFRGRYSMEITIIMSKLNEKTIYKI